MGDFEIIPTIGVGRVRFGQSPAEVEAAMAEPQAYEDWMGGNLNDSLLYRGLILGFDQCDAHAPLRGSRLVEARLTSQRSAVLLGRAITEWTRPEFLAALLTRDATVTESKHDVSVPALGLSVSFDDAGRIEYVEIWELAPEPGPAV